MIRAESQTTAEQRTKSNGKVNQLVAGGASAGTCGGRHVASGKKACQGTGVRAEGSLGMPLILSVRAVCWRRMHKNRRAENRKSEI